MTWRTVASDSVWLEFADFEQPVFAIEGCVRPAALTAAIGPVLLR